MKSGLYVCKNEYCGGVEYKILATQRFKDNLKLAGVFVVVCLALYLASWL
jgi:hypothetical protein